MKKTFKFILLSMTLSIGIQNASAACSYSEKASLNQEVANIKVRYETGEKQLNPEDYVCGEFETEEEMEECVPTYDYLNMNILNLNEHFYVVVTDEVDHIKKTYRYSDIDENGIVSFPWTKLGTTNNFTFTIYSSDETSCPNERMRVIYQTTPKRNLNADLEICSKIPDYYLCEKFVTTKEDIPFEEFIVKAEKELASRQEEEKEKNKTFWEKVLEFIKDNKVVIIVGAAVIVVIAAGSVTIIKKKRELK